MGGAACSRGAQLAQRRKIQSCVAFFWTLPPFLPPLQLIEPVASSIRFQFRFTGNFSQIEPTLAPSDWELLEVCFCWLNSEFLHTFQFYFVCHACASWNKVGVEISKNLNESVSNDHGPYYLLHKRLCSLDSNRPCWRSWRRSNRETHFPFLPPSCSWPRCPGQAISKWLFFLSFFSLCLP